jgi:hypothetical protein
MHKTTDPSLHLREITNEIRLLCIHPANLTSTSSARFIAYVKPSESLHSNTSLRFPARDLPTRYVYSRRVGDIHHGTEASPTKLKPFARILFIKPSYGVLVKALTLELAMDEPSAILILRSCPKLIILNMAVYSIYTYKPNTKT